MMQTKTAGFTPDELALIKMADDDQLYDKSHFAVLSRQLVVDNGNKGFFKVFSYKDSLRFSILMTSAPGKDATKWFTDEIRRYSDNTEKNTVLLWYMQLNGFSSSLLQCFDNSTEPYHYFYYRIARDDIDPIVDLKGLEIRRCTEDMIDTCIEVMEDLFTPFPDLPGSFRQDRERIKSEFLSERGDTSLFFICGELVGFCGHISGHITEVCVRKEFQGNGYGEVIVRAILRLIYEAGLDAELTTGGYNAKAQHVYEKAGFQKIYETTRVTLTK